MDYKDITVYPDELLELLTSDGFLQAVKRLKAAGMREMDAYHTVNATHKKFFGYFKYGGFRNYRIIRNRLSTGKVKKDECEYEYFSNWILK